MELIRNIPTALLILVIAFLASNINASEKNKNITAIKYNFNISINGESYEPFSATLAIGVPATLTYSNGIGDENLKIKVVAQPSKTSGKAIISHSVLQKISGSWIELSSPTIEFSDTSSNDNIIFNMQESSEITISGTTELITVSSEALSKSLKMCPEFQEVGSNIDNSVVLSQASSCCGRICDNGQRWQCCGAISCCNCGLCCQTP